MCEAKTGQVGLDQADSRNMHSASIAVRAMFSYYAATFGSEPDRTKGLLGRILVFTVSHNNSLVNLHGHCAVAAEESDINQAHSAADAYNIIGTGLPCTASACTTGKTNSKHTISC